MDKVKKQHLTHYNNVTDFVLACNKPVLGKRSVIESRKVSNNSWAGGSWEEANELAINGWEKGLKNVSDKLDLIRSHGGKEPIFLHDIVGHVPDVARFVSGMPDCMRRKIITESSKKPCIDILVNITYGCGVDADNILNYGTAIASVIDELEHSGYSMSLRVGYIIDGGIGNKGCTVNIKSQGEHLDMGKMIYFIAHPTALRRLFFGWVEGHFDYSDAGGTGYGYVTCEFNDRPELYFGNSLSLSDCDTPEGAMKYVKDIIRKQQSELLQAA